MKRLISSVLVVFITLFSAIPASAVLQNKQTSPFDSNDGSGYIYSGADISYIQVAEDPSSPDDFLVFVIYRDWVARSQFMGSKDYLLVYFDTNGDGEMDYYTAAPSSFYPANLNATSTIMLDADTNLLSSCSVDTWMSDGYSSSDNWVGFQFSKTCFPMGSTIGISAYSNYLSYFDYTEFFTFTTGVQQTIVPSFDLPTAESAQGYKVNSPANQPTNLVDLSPRILKSTVQIVCGNASGSGWAANVTLPTSVISSGYKTAVITNNHVVEGCLSSKVVQVMDSSGAISTGVIYANDATNDLAGIYITTALSPLEWQGEKPAQGWWVGVLGAPKTIYGYLSTGIVSLVQDSDSLLGISAAINPGNSGGPAFDRNGRVIGVVTWKVTDSEGMGIAQGTPRLCSKIIICAAPANVWAVNLSSAPGSTTDDEASTPAESVVPKLDSVNKILSTFPVSSFALTSKLKSQVKAAVADYPSASKFICTSVITSKTSKANATLFRKRAKAVCDYAKSLKPALSIWYQSKQSTKSSAEGMQLLTIKY